MRCLECAALYSLGYSNEAPTSSCSCISPPCTHIINIYVERKGVASGELRLICLDLGVRREASYDWWFFWEGHWWVFPLRCKADLGVLFPGD